MLTLQLYVGRLRWSDDAKYSRFLCSLLLISLSSDEDANSLTGTFAGVGAEFLLVNLEGPEPGILTSLASTFSR